MGLDTNALTSEICGSMSATALEKIDGITLCSGVGDVRNNALCVMQAVDYVASGGTSDHPECASPVITSFLIRWNDTLPTDADRDRLLRPLIADVVGTRTTDADDLTRSWLAYDWLVRTHLVAWLRLSPSLVVHANAVAARAPITSSAALDAAWPTIAIARAAGAAAWGAAWDSARAAAGAAAWDAAWDAARAAARAAAGAAASDAAAAAAGAAAWDSAWDSARAGAAAWGAAGDAVWDAARAAARAAAWDAARAAAGAAAWDSARAAASDALVETAAALQLSAQELVRDMCAVGRGVSI